MIHILLIGVVDPPKVQRRRQGVFVCSELRLKWKVLKAAAKVSGAIGAVTLESFNFWCLQSVSIAHCKVVSVKSLHLFDELQRGGAKSLSSSRRSRRVCQEHSVNLAVEISAKAISSGVFNVAEV